MKPIEIDFELLIDTQDEELKPLVQQIVENRNREEEFDQELEEDLIKCLEEVLENRIREFEESTGMEYEETMSLEEVFTYDIPQEIAEDIDSMAMERVDMMGWMEEREQTIIDRLNSLGQDGEQERNPDIHDKILSIDSKSIDRHRYSELEPDLEPEFEYAV